MLTSPPPTHKHCRCAGGLPWAPLAPSVDGCYVLKTTLNKDAGGCTCTLFSLTRVCAGQPLEQQLLDTWLSLAR